MNETRVSFPSVYHCYKSKRLSFRPSCAGDRRGIHHHNVFDTKKQNKKKQKNIDLTNKSSGRRRSAKDIQDVYVLACLVFLSFLQLHTADIGGQGTTSEVVQSVMRVIQSKGQLTSEL